jgi:hypothetical protein
VLQLRAVHLWSAAISKNATAVRHHRQRRTLVAHNRHILGIAGGVFVSRRVLNRVDAMTHTAQTIWQASFGRLPVAGRAMNSTG